MVETIISVVAAVIALAAAGFTAWQANVAKKALMQTGLNNFFASFDQANQAALEAPEILYDVHGLSREIPTGEVRNLVYLSILLDGYQHYWSDQLNSNMEKAADMLKKESTFLNRILAIPENQERWEKMKTIFYGDFDKPFIRVIDEIIEHEKRTSGQ